MNAYGNCSQAVTRICDVLLLLDPRHSVGLADRSTSYGYCMDAPDYLPAGSHWRGHVFTYDRVVPRNA